jgi:predicted glycosyltransferase
MKTRLLFYSHDSFGLGHFRRSLTIAGYLARQIEGASSLMMTGLDSAATFEVPRGVDFVKLPGIRKCGAEEYRSRHLRVSFARVQRLREQLIRGVVRSFDPAVFIVDNVPLGVDRELLSTLRYLRKRRPETKIVLTLRDILDVPELIVPLWKETGVYRVLRDYYDEIWIAGCRSVFDSVSAYEFPKRVADKARYCGYVVRHPSPEDAESVVREFKLDESPFVLVSCGGGEDGAQLVEAYVDVAPRLMRDGFRSVVFLGPDMPPPFRRRLKERLLPMADYVTTFDYRPDLVTFMEHCAASVSMGGYNTTCEVLAQRKPAVIVPRTEPREEQLLRARLFSEYGLLNYVTPSELSADTLEGAIRGALHENGAGGGPALPGDLDFRGLGRITRRVRKQLGLSVDDED